MAVSESFLNYVRELLEPLGHLDEQRFFSGRAFRQDGVQFAMVMGGTLYFVVDEQTRLKYEDADSEPFSYNKKGGTVDVRKYYRVPDDVLDDVDAIVDWAVEAIHAARAMK